MEGKIYKAISQTMQDVGVVGKDNFNEQQRFKFRGIDAVMNALNPAMIKNGIFVVPQVLEQIREERITSKGGKLIYSICKIKYTFYAEDGSFVEAITVGEGMDSGDKATNKAMAIAFKYACFQVFCIPTEEMKDPDAEVHELAAEEERKQQVNQQKITEKDVNALMAMIEKKGVACEAVLDRYHVNTFNEMTFAQFNNAMNILNKSKDKVGA